MNNNKVFIIAELSANHNNDFSLAVKTIEEIAKTGADAVKIQTYTADSLTLNVDNEHFGPLKEGLWKGTRLYDLYTQASMPYEWQPKLKKIAEDLGLVFFSSPFDKEGVDFLESMDVPLYKIASFEITDIPLIKYVASKGKPVIISTGVAEIKDIELALEACKSVGNENITLLKCTSEYPAPIEGANLLTIPNLKQKFGVNVGVSDHTMGSIVPTVAVALGATVVEKHLILDRNLGGPDSSFSMEPQEFAEMVKAVRSTEAALGKVTYEVSEKNKLKRRSLFATKDILAGEPFTSENVKSVRPGHGLAPKHYTEIIGQKVNRNVKAGTPITKDILSYDYE
ncbi:pseudaminic acid synthase [Pontibacter roseus]|uniref:pseudaminic acid synthase n=1 Tax=Pontibacter roseus TaxID=336989 RepID=UPI00037E6FAC|nr:pseudaminic acid synthase [Pontibacter roseus]